MSLDKCDKAHKPLKTHINVLTWAIYVYGVLTLGTLGYAFTAVRAVAQVKNDYVSMREYIKDRKADEDLNRKILEDLAEIKGYLKGKKENGHGED
jgi:hypothetical protein